MSSDLLKKAFATWQHVFLSTSITFYNIFVRVCAEIKILRFLDEEVTESRPSKYLGFSFFHNFFFFALISFLSFSYLFAAVVDLGLPPTSEKASSRSMGNFYHGEATCSHRKFCSEFFTQISEHFCAYLRLHWADHFELGIITKFFFSCKSWVWMMPILVKGDHVRSGKSQRVKKAKLFTRWLT